MTDWPCLASGAGGGGGGASNVTVAAVAGGSSPARAVMFCEPLAYSPGAAATSTCTVHDGTPAGRLPDAAIVGLPGSAATAAPVHVDAMFGSGATVSPPASASVKLQPAFSASSDVFVIVAVSREVAPAATGDVNARSSFGVASRTVMSSRPWSLPVPVAVALRMRSPTEEPLMSAARGAV